MKPDPIIDRIRKARHEISARFDHDPRRMAQYYMELQKQLPPERLYKPSERKTVAVPDVDETSEP